MTSDFVASPFTAVFFHFEYFDEIVEYDYHASCFPKYTRVRFNNSLVFTTDVAIVVVVPSF